MRADETRKALTSQLGGLDSTLQLGKPNDVTLILPDVRQVLQTWEGRFAPPPLQDIPESAKLQGCAQFQHDEVSMVPFGEYCEPPETERLPRLPQQEPTPGFHPTEWNHLHNKHTAGDTAGKLQLWETE